MSNGLLNEKTTEFTGSITQKDLENWIKDLQSEPVKPYQMMIGEGIIQVVYDTWGKEGLRAWLSDPNYEFMMGSKAYELALKLME